MTEQQLETLGRLADAADNYAQWALTPGPAYQRVNAMKSGLEDIGRQLKELYVELSGRDPWSLSDG